MNRRDPNRCAGWQGRHLRPLRSPGTDEFDRVHDDVLSSSLGIASIARDNCRTGPRRQVPLIAYCVAAALTGAMEPRSELYVARIAAQVKALTDVQRALLGISPSIVEDRDIYDAVWRTHDKATALFSDRPDLLGDLARQPIPTWAYTKARAIDGTSFPTCGTFKAARNEMTLDGDPDSRPPDEEITAKPMRAEVRGIGPDGRDIYTTDLDARAGWETATDSRAGGYYNGYELHLAVLAADVLWTNYIDEVKLGPTPPLFVTSFNLTPAGSHRGDASLALIKEELAAGLEITNVIADRGITQSRPETWAIPLRLRGIDQTMLLRDFQRKVSRLNDDILLVDGTPFSDHLTADQLGAGLDGEGRIIPLPSSGRNAPADARRKNQDPFNHRAVSRFAAHTNWDPNGKARFRCPYHSHMAWAPQNAAGLRAPRHATPMRPLREGRHRCCKQSTYTIDIKQIPDWQPIPYGTTAHAASYARRQVVETVNSMLKAAGGFDRKFMRVMGLSERRLLTAFSIYGHNRRVADAPATLRRGPAHG